MSETVCGRMALSETEAKQLLLFLLLWETDLRKYCHNLCQNVLPVFSSRSFMASCLMFKFLKSLCV